MRRVVLFLILTAAVLAPLVILYRASHRAPQIQRAGTAVIADDVPTPRLEAAAGFRERAIELDDAGDDGFALPSSQALAAVDHRLFDQAIPLHERIVELDARARRGDAGAGCQLAIELVRCANERNMQGYHDTAEERVGRLARQPLSAAQLRGRVDFELSRQENNRRVLSSCEGVRAADWAAPARYLHAAAERGHAGAQLLFLQNELWRSDALMRDPGLIALLRSAAPRYLEQRLRHGDRHVIDRLEGARNGDPLAEVLPAPWNAPGLGDALHRLEVLAAGRELVGEQREVDPHTEALARDLYDRWFANAEPRSAALADLRMGSVDDFGCEALATGAAP